jgi:dihydrofolate reductase
MGTISYYLATTIDGYLARENGAVDWLEPFQFKLQTPYDYELFYKSVTVVMMGRKTWEVAKSFEEKPYSDRKAYVISTKTKKEDIPEYVELIKTMDRSFVEKMKSKTNGRIWIVGGAQIASQLLELDLIDEIIQTIVPVTLGRGIRWIMPNNGSATWNLQDSFKCERGVVQLVYRRSGE